jgi:hypothetical protein
MIGYIDESVRESSGGLTYVVASLVVVEDPEGVRAVLRSLLLEGQSHLHWRNESDDRRQELIKSLGELPVCAHAAIVRDVTPRRQEKARSKALVKLLRETQIDLSGVVIEARASHLNDKDVATIKQAKQAGTVREDLAHEFARKKEEPLLWAADLVTSAFAMSQTVKGNPYAVEVEALVIETYRVRTP